MLRRALTFLAALALLGAGGGCAALTEDEADALAILERAEQASANLESVSFTMAMKGEAAGQAFTIQADGGGYLEGEREGDMVMRMSLGGAGMPATNMQMVAIDDRVFTNLTGTWEELPGGLDALGAGTAAGSQLEGQLAALDVASYVKDVHVENGTVFLGEPVTKIVGSIDVEDMMSNVLSQLGSAGSVAGGAVDVQGMLDGVDVSDIRVAIYVSDVTSLVRAVHMEFSMETGGETATFDVDLSIRDVNEPVDIPEPAVTA